MNSHKSVIHYIAYIYIKFIAVSGGKNQECKERKDLKQVDCYMGPFINFVQPKKSSGEYNIARVF